ncbi:MAG: heat-inducible transcriptional repressor HrcA, partial [FCB group bacterium]|nr:heat-inducible transcriptional repressor HrcA [FCB group bacterium]
EREQLILQAVVHTYITTAEAVGSRTIVKRYALDVSPATVRNTMADLEETGFLEQLHTSSGRVPTDRGYRYYVDTLMRVQELTPEERSSIERELRERADDAEEALRHVSQLLAMVTRQTGLVEAPSEGEAELQRIEIVPIVATRLAAMIADTYGRVRTVQLTLDRTLSDAEAQRLNQFLNEHLKRVPLSRLLETVRAKAQSATDEERPLAELAFQVLSLLPSQRVTQMFLEGASQLFEQPEFRDIGRAHEVFSLLEERSRLSEVLRSRMGPGMSPRVTITIGSEAGEHALEEISVVVAPYKVGDRTVGVLGVLGPRRMPYSRLTAIVDYTADLLGRHLTHLAG